ncbi:MAG: hypothetical protein ACO3JL_05550 [Myxococcota bacterium]
MQRPDPREDRLVATGAENETVYAAMNERDLLEVLRSHFEEDHAVEALTLLAREREVPATSATARNLRRLRRMAEPPELDPPADE